jgi:hypothetical protein
MVYLCLKSKIISKYVIYILKIVYYFPTILKEVVDYLDRQRRPRNVVQEFLHEEDNHETAEEVTVCPKCHKCFRRLYLHLDRCEVTCNKRN